MSSVARTCASRTPSFGGRAARPAPMLRVPGVSALPRARDLWSPDRGISPVLGQARTAAPILRGHDQRSDGRSFLNERSGASLTSTGGIRDEEDPSGGRRGPHDDGGSGRLDVGSRRQRQLGLTDINDVRRGPTTHRSAPGADPLVFRLYAGVALVLLLATVWYGVAHGTWSDVAVAGALFWCLMCGAANLLAAPAAAHTYLSMSAPVNIAIAALFPPSVAAVLVAIGSISQLEVQRQTTPLRAAFNRTQLGLSTAAAAAVLGLRPLPTAWTVLLAVTAYHLTNWTLVAGAERTARGTAVTRVLRGFVPRGPVPAATYLSLGAMGVVLGLVYLEIGAWAVALLLLPLAGARQAVRATEDIRRAERERRALADRLVEERESERVRIASDLHDTVLQSLAAVQVQADNVRVAVQRADPRAEAVAGAVRDGVDGTIADVRRVIANLRHAGIDVDGFVPTLRRYVEAFGRSAGCTVDLRVPEPAEALPTPIALLLLESCQEALTNIARHAAASTVVLDLEVHPGQVQLVVEDDGRGFATDSTSTGFGLSLTREKVALLGGGCWVQSAPGRGTRVVVRVPLLTSGDGRG